MRKITIGDSETRSADIVAENVTHLQGNRSFFDPRIQSRGSGSCYGPTRVRATGIADFRINLDYAKILREKRMKRG